MEIWTTLEEMGLYKEMDLKIKEKEAQELWGVSAEEVEDYFSKLLNKFKQDPKYELRQELGKMCFKNINDFTPEELNRYNELLELLKD